MNASLLSPARPPTSPRLAGQLDLLRWEAAIDGWLARLSLEQKVGQLHQIALPNPHEEELIRRGQIGSALFATGAFTGHQLDQATSWDEALRLQRLSVEETGLPLLFARDVIHGHHTVFPIPLGQAAGWNPELVEKSQQNAAAEAACDGLHWTFAPVADIGRDPRWGRVAEGYGEDPVLSARLTAAAVRGFQCAPYPVLACLKHFAGYGLAEGGRDYARAGVGPRELREVYLPSFKAGIDAGAATVMAAFNEIDGIPATAHAHLLREILKGEWGFQGVVVSDWNAIEELVCHGVAADRREAARLAIEAGIDIDMVSGCYHEHLAALVREGVVNEALVDDAVRRVLRLKFAIGLFDDPLRENSRPKRPRRETALKLARDFARDTCVLLKNANHLLPLKNVRTILLAGPFAEAREELFGTWTCDGKPEWVITVADALRAATKAEVRVQRVTDSMVEAAMSADVVVALMGEHPMRSGEAHSVTDLGLPPGQLEFLETLARAGKPLATVVFTGRALALAEVQRISDALLIAWHPGSSGGPALADILTGAASPSGRLPVSFPVSTGQVPVHYSRHATGRPLPLPASRYLDASDRPLFPFGFGLTYSELRYDNLRIKAAAAHTWRIKMSVHNVGARAEKAHVQLYIRDLVASRCQPVKLLKNFTSIDIAAQSSAEVELVLKKEDLAFCRADGAWGAEAGEFRIWMGPSSEEGLEGTITL